MWYRASAFLLCALTLTARLHAAETARNESASARSAASASPSNDELQRRAQSLYAEGVSAYRAQRYKDAIDAFRAADGLVPSPALSYNTALAYEKLYDSAQALSHYRDYLRRAPNGASVQRVQGRVHALEQALSKRGVQQLTVLSQPPGATVAVDGVPRGITPFTGEFAPGSHRVELSLRGFRDATQTLELPTNRAIDVSLGLERSVAEPRPSARAATQPEPARPRKISPLPWAVLGAGSATLLVAGGFELARRSAEDAAHSERTQLGYQHRLEQVDARANAARILAGVGGVLTVAGGGLLFYELRGPQKEHPRQASAFTFDPGRGVLSYRRQF